MWAYLLLLCFPYTTLGCRSSEEIEGSPHKNKAPKYFSSASWGGWTPTDNSWKRWIELWGTENSSVAFDSTEVGRNAESGWPRYWKGMGKGNAGVPPPPWAYIPNNYGRPTFCYLQPAVGNCKELLSRWGFNPTTNNCQQFLYSGCGANENNFMNKNECEQACGRVPDTDCVWGKVDFRDYISEEKE